MDDFTRLTIAYALVGVLLLVGMVRLLRPARLGVVGWDDAARRRLRLLGALAPAQADGAVFGEKEGAGFAFLKRERVWLALGDPAPFRTVLFRIHVDEVSGRRAVPGA